MNQKEYQLIAHIIKRNREGYKGTSKEAEAWEVSETLKYEFMLSLSLEYTNFDGGKFQAYFDKP